MEAELTTQNKNILYIPAVEEGIELVWERKGQAGKLTFTVVDDGALVLEEGDPVSLLVDGVGVFYGFVFTKKHDKSGLIGVVAYDQIRYLVKNKDTIVYEGKKASDLVRMLAGDYRLQCGVIEDTSLVIESGVEENKTLIDILANALDITLQGTKTLFTLYDDFGKLTLRRTASMRLDLLIDEETGESFDYESSIDRQTYNKIKLTYDNEKTGKRDVFIAQSGESINNWGVLQHFEGVDSPTGAIEKANALLGLYNQKTRSLTVTGAFGDIRVRAGCSVAVLLDLGDTMVSSFLLVETVKHQLNESEHTMDLTLIGGEFIA